MPNKGKKVLLLGGTAEARQIAEAAVTQLPRDIEIISSFAGRTRRPQDPPGLVREGGFGGAQGMIDYIRKEDVRLVVDATHPFAATISDHAYDACHVAEVSRLQLVRPPWRLPPSARWVEVADMASAAEAISGFAKRVLLSTGTQSISAFAGLEDIWFLVRMIDQPPEPLDLANHELILARPPFGLADEQALMETHSIDTLVSKHAGGKQPAKIDAALALGVVIVLIQPPPPPPGTRAAGVDEVLTWIRTQI